MVIKKARKSNSRGAAVSASSAGTDRAHAGPAQKRKLEDWAPGTEREPHHHIPPVIRNLLHVPKPFKTLKYSASKKHKNLKQLLASEKATVNVDVPTHTSISAPPSLRPQKKYCDITGLEARYTDPKTRLRYHNLDVYQHIRGLNQNVVQEHLLLRNAAVVLK